MGLVSCKVKEERSTMNLHCTAKLRVLMVSDVLSVFGLLVVSNSNVFTWCPVMQQLIRVE